jgi:hypothetical protein
MDTKTKRQVVYTRKYNENACTAMNPCTMDPATVDLNATDWFCMSSDNDMRVKARLYEIREIELPEWLGTEEWIRNEIDWAYTWGAGVDPSWPEAWQRSLFTRSFDERYVYAKLLKTKKFRSAWRQEMRDHLVRWMEGNKEFPHPHSKGEFAKLANFIPTYEVKRVQEEIYRNRRYGHFSNYL